MITNYESEVFGRNYWSYSLEAPLHIPSLSLPSSADVVIVGAGITGLFAGMLLSRKGLNVICLDAGTIAGLASSTNGGILTLGYKQSSGDLVKRLGIEVTVDLYRMALQSYDLVERTIAEEKIECNFSSKGHVELASKLTHYSAMQENAEFIEKHINHRYEHICKSDVSQYIGSTKYHGATLDRQAKSMHPLKFMHGVALAARRYGVHLHEHVEVKRIHRLSGKYTLETSKGIITAPNIILATNAYLGDLFPWLQQRTVAVGSQIIATKKLSSSLCKSLMEESFTASDTLRMLSYFRLSPDGKRLLFGGRRPLMAFSPQRQFMTTYRSMLETYPQLKGVSIDYAWSGNVCMTRDHMPLIGQIDGLYFAIGYNGGGMGLGAFLGTKVAESLLGHKDELPYLRDRIVKRFPAYLGRHGTKLIGYAYYRLIDIFA